MRCRTLHLLFALVMLLFTLYGCGYTPVPKPMGYPRTDFPEKEYTRSDSLLPYSFEMPTYALLRTQPKEAYAYDLLFPDFNATLHLTYYDSPDALTTLMEDSRKMAYQHSVRAESIGERVYTDTSRRVYAVLYELGGDVASAVQFYATDSVSHFLRGALYFYTVPNADSLAPSVSFFREDVVHLLETLQWAE